MLQIPTAWLSLFDVIFVLLVLPFVDRVLYPALDRRGWKLSTRQRIVIGMFFAFASVAVAGFVEHKRLNAYWHTELLDGHEVLVNHTVFQIIGACLCLYQFFLY